MRSGIHLHMAVRGLGAPPEDAGEICQKRRHVFDFVCNLELPIELLILFTYIICYVSSLTYLCAYLLNATWNVILDHYCSIILISWQR